ncbi:MAG: hypothetical protein JSS58_06085 [Proteobacteria bacterium]|nr:hypothetical protein [Pseudomonadota bacterium]
MNTNDTVLIYAINRTNAWWKHVGNHLGFERHVVVSDIRGAGDRDVVDDFNAEYARQIRLADIRTIAFSEEEVQDIIARCRLLRWLPAKQARCMIAAMEYAFTKVLDEVNPCIVLSFPIDRYVSDVLERLSKRRGLRYVELTASLISGMCMLMYRGQLLQTAPTPLPEVLDHHVKTIADPSFTPSYVQTATRYTRRRWLKTFGYFRVRGWGFKLISWIKRDPRSLHYLDAQSFLGHKPRLADLQTLDLIDWNWRESLDHFPRERRIFFGLQLFPEASIDYWITNIGMIDYENLMVAAARAFVEAGFLVLVKDHPSQFGFRQRELIKRLKSLPNVIFLPYEVSGNEAVDLVGANFTLTGTLGLQSALLGRVSVVSPTYYVTTGDFLTFDTPEQIAALPKRVSEWQATNSLQDRQRRILSHLLQGSFEGDFFSFRGFDPQHPAETARTLAKNLGQQLRILLNEMPHADLRTWANPS